MISINSVLSGPPFADDDDDDGDFIFGNLVTCAQFRFRSDKNPTMDLSASSDQLPIAKISWLQLRESLGALTLEDNPDLKFIPTPPLPILTTGRPKYTKEAILYIEEIGRGSTCRVHKCIYVPTLSLVAVRKPLSCSHF